MEAAAGGSAASALTDFLDFGGMFEEDAEEFSEEA